MPPTALEAVGEFDHGAAALGGGGLVGDAAHLGLLRRLLGDHGLDALDGPADGADLVAAGRLANRRVDIALRHAPEYGDEVRERPGDTEHGDERRERQRAEKAQHGREGQDDAGVAGRLIGLPLRLREFGRQKVDPRLNLVVQLRAGCRSLDEDHLARRLALVSQTQLNGPFRNGEEDLSRLTQIPERLASLGGVGQREKVIEGFVGRGDGRVVALLVAIHLGLAGLDDDVADLDARLVDVDPDRENALESLCLDIHDLSCPSSNLRYRSVSVIDHPHGNEEDRQGRQDRLHDQFCVRQNPHIFPEDASPKASFCSFRYRS